MTYLQGIPFVFAVVNRGEHLPLSTIPVGKVTSEDNVIGHKTVWVKPQWIPLRGYGCLLLDEIYLEHQV